MSSNIYYLLLLYLSRKKLCRRRGLQTSDCDKLRPVGRPTRTVAYVRVIPLNEWTASKSQMTQCNTQYEQVKAESL